MQRGEKGEERLRDVLRTFAASTHVHTYAKSNNSRASHDRGEEENKYRE